MSDRGNCWPMLDQNSRQPELMQRMMVRIGVNQAMAARVDGGMAWADARTKCIFCHRTAECCAWLEGPETVPMPTGLCPNIEFFRWCTEYEKPAGVLATA
jgi:Family of unknown function (DUF6455)